MIQQDDILQRLLSSDTKADLITLFRKNPGLIDTIDGVARRIGKKGILVESEVNDLISLGFLQTKKFGNKTAIFRNERRDKEIQEVVANRLSKSGGRSGE